MIWLVERGKNHESVFNWRSAKRRHTIFRFEVMMTTKACSNKSFILCRDLTWKSYVEVERKDTWTITESQTLNLPQSCTAKWRLLYRSRRAERTHRWKHENRAGSSLITAQSRKDVVTVTNWQNFGITCFSDNEENAGLLINSPYPLDNGQRRGTVVYTATEASTSQRAMVTNQIPTRVCQPTHLNCGTTRLNPLCYSIQVEYYANSASA